MKKDIPALRCPECGLKNMREIERFAVEIDTCMNCFGIWFDAAEMAEYAKGRDQVQQESVVPDTAFAPNQGEGCTSCPRCSVLGLQAGKAGSYELRVCTNCHGVFLPKRTHTLLFAPVKSREIKSTIDSGVAAPYLAARGRAGLSIFGALSQALIRE